MIYYLYIDKNNYLEAIATVGEGIKANLEFSDYDFSGGRLNAYKWENDTLIFDADRYAEIEAENKVQKEAETSPTKLEQLRADVDYIAVMTGVEL